jgi:hypothetical protein
MKLNVMQKLFESKILNKYDNKWGCYINCGSNDYENKTDLKSYIDDD